MNNNINTPASKLCEIVHDIYNHGWCPGTGGNFSVVLDRNPIQILITQSGKNKKTICSEDFVIVDLEGQPLVTEIGKPSAETLLHCEIVSMTTATSVLHTHSIWNTLLGKHFCCNKGFFIENFEMQKGLKGVVSHETKEFIPILENSQDMVTLRLQVRDLLKENPNIHCFLLAGHGLYTWGESLEEAYRHVEILEFLFECVGRQTNFAER